METLQNAEFWFYGSPKRQVNHFGTRGKRRGKSHQSQTADVADKGQMCSVSKDRYLADTFTTALVNYLLPSPLALIFTSCVSRMRQTPTRKSNLPNEPVIRSAFSCQPKLKFSQAHWNCNKVGEMLKSGDENKRKLRWSVRQSRAKFYAWTVSALSSRWMLVIHLKIKILWILMNLSRLNDAHQQLLLSTAARSTIWKNWLSLTFRAQLKSFVVRLSIINHRFQEHSAQK